MFGFNQYVIAVPKAKYDVGYAHRLDDREFKGVDALFASLPESASAYSVERFLRVFNEGAVSPETHYVSYVWVKAW